MKLAAPLLLPLLLMGGAAGVCGKQGKATSLDQFMEEVRGALASHWELLQNLRYHTLGIKVRLVQLEAQIKNLSEHLNAAESSQDTGESRGWNARIQLEPRNPIRPFRGCLCVSLSYCSDE